MGGLGWTPMPWQQELLDIAFEVDAFGQLWYHEIVIVIMRQSGKSTIVIPWALHRMIAWPERQFGLYIAQTRDKALEKLVEEQFYAIDRSPFRRLLVPNRSGRIQPMLSHGSEHLKFVNGSKWAIDAPTEEAGHGGTLGLAVGDEIFALRDNRLETGLMPTMATVPDAQSLWISTPGKSKIKSPFMWQKVEKGRARVELARLDPTQLGQSRSLYIEFSIPLDADVYDPANWWNYMPAVGYTQTIETIRGFADSMDEPEFRRGFACQWGDDLGKDWKIPRDKWDGQRDRESELSERLTWVLDVSPDRAWASIGVAAVRDDGSFHIEVVDDGPGTSWLIDGDPDRDMIGIAKLIQQHGGEVYADFLTVGPFGPDLIEAGIDIHWIGASDVMVAAPMLLDYVLNNRVWHLGQTELDAALSSAATATLGDGWRWSRGKSMQPICALVTVTLALRMLVQTLPDINHDPLDALREGTEKQ